MYRCARLGAPRADGNAGWAAGRLWEWSTRPTQSSSVLPEKFAPMGLTYDDVLLLPGYSELGTERHRHHHPADPRDPRSRRRWSAPRWTPSPRAGWRSRWPARAASGCSTATCRSRTRPTRSTWSSGPRPGSSPTPSRSAPTQTLEDLDSHLRRVPRLRPSRRRHRQPPPRHHHQPRPALHPRRGVGDHQGRRGDDPDAADHRPDRHHPRRGHRDCCASTSASGCR